MTDPVSFGPDLAEVFGPSQSDGGPDLVQLLTPEGERVHHPEFDHDFSAEELRGLYRDMVLTRRIDVEATALQRHGELGIWAQLLGQEAAQIGAGRAMRPQDYAFPTYREHGVAYCKGVDPLRLLGLFRGVDQGGWDPNENNFGLYTIVIGAQTLHATGYAMGMQRDGVVGTGDPERDSAVIAHFGDGASSQGDVNEAFIFAASYNAPGRVLLPEQPVGHLRADRAPDPHPALPARAGLRLPGHPRRRQRRAGDVRRHEGRAAARARRATARRSSRPTPTGWVRTPRPTTRRATASTTSSSTGSSRTRSSGSRSTCAATAWSTSSSSTTSTPRPRSWATTSARAARRCPTRSRWTSSATSSAR